MAAAHIIKKLGLYKFHDRYSISDFNGTHKRHLALFMFKKLKKKILTK